MKGEGYASCLQQCFTTDNHSADMLTGIAEGDYGF